MVGGVEVTAFHWSEDGTSRVHVSERETTPADLTGQQVRTASFKTGVSSTVPGPCPVRDSTTVSICGIHIRPKL